MKHDTGPSDRSDSQIVSETHEATGKEPYRKPEVLATYSKGDLEAAIQPSGGGGCGCGSILEQ